MGADARPAGVVSFIGTVKWLPDAPITSAEVATLAQQSTAVPGVGASTALVGVCPAGAHPGTALRRVWTVDDLLEAWP